MSLPPYPSYKEGGGWLGRVPSHWDVVPIKRLVDRVIGQATSKSFPVALENIEGWTGRFIETEGDYSGAGVAFSKGDVLFGKLRPYLAKAWVATNDGQAIGDFHVLRCKSEVRASFIHSLLLTKEIISQVDGSTYGAKMPRASWQFIASLPAIKPPPEEQDGIISFLTSELAKIDGLIEEQNCLQGLLREKRQAIITETVGRGLSSSGYSNTGIDWLPKIPHGWKLTRLKWVTSEITVGVVVTPAKYYADVGVPALRSLNVREMEVSLNDCVFFDQASHELLSKSSLREGDLVTVRTGKPGTTAIITQELHGVNCIDLIIIRKSAKILSRFLAYLMNSSIGHVQYALGSEGALHQHFNVGAAANLRVPLPSTEEQEAIVLHIDREIGKLDATMNEASRIIALLRERRAALISAAITGKIDVRSRDRDMQEAA